MSVQALRTRLCIRSPGHPVSKRRTDVSGLTKPELGKKSRPLQGQYRHKGNESQCAVLSRSFRVGNCLMRRWLVYWRTTATIVDSGNDHARCCHIPGKHASAVSRRWWHMVRSLTICIRISSWPVSDKLLCSESRPILPRFMLTQSPMKDVDRDEKRRHHDCRHIFRSLC
jgi:hypothetical protein